MINYKKFIIILGLFILPFLGIGTFLTFLQIKQKSLIYPIVKATPTPTIKPLEKYSFENLKKRKFSPRPIILDKILTDDPSFASYLFYFTSDGKKVSGLANIPKKRGKFPVIVQFRGYIDPKTYATGTGTVHSGEVFAKNGFITLAPDFLGYGSSASASADAIEARFETYTTALNLLASVENLNKSLKLLINNIEADTDKVGIWGHSNGGHIALSVLEITGKPYPTVLWNPVSRPFPYSILYYSDEAEDHGKALRKVVADFEKDYDAEKYSPTNYFDFINAPIELYQGEADEAVPKRWSDELYKILTSFNKEIIYYIYPGDNHDFARGSWETVVERNITFYKKHFSKD